MTRSHLHLAAGAAIAALSGLNFGWSALRPEHAWTLTVSMIGIALGLFCIGVVLIGGRRSS